LHGLTSGGAWRSGAAHDSDMALEPKGYGGYSALAVGPWDAVGIAFGPWDSSAGYLKAAWQDFSFVTIWP